METITVQVLGGMSTFCSKVMLIIPVAWSGMSVDLASLCQDWFDVFFPSGELREGGRTAERKGARKRKLVAVKRLGLVVLRE